MNASGVGSPCVISWGPSKRVVLAWIPRHGIGAHDHQVLSIFLEPTLPPVVAVILSVLNNEFDQDQLAQVMLNLKDVTLVACSSTELEAHIQALQYSSRGIEFGETLLLAHEDPHPKLNFYRFERVRRFTDVADWGQFIVFELHKYVKTPFIILVHADGFVVHPQKWDDQFLSYDYIGAPWPLPKDNFSYRDHFGNIIRVGNSVSLRSKRMLELPSQLKLDWNNADHGFFHEDGFLCVQHRHTLQEHGIKFPPLDMACRFARERTIPENRHIVPFAFHKWQGQNRFYPKFSQKSTLSAQISKAAKRLSGAR